MIFKNLSFEVSKGENLEIIGSNGSGKTSLLKCILGLIEKKQGHITWNEIPLEESRALFLKSCHYQGHQLALKNNFSVFQNLKFSHLAFNSNEKQILHSLKEVGLFDESYFLYFEDADLSKRMSLAGYPLKYCSNSIVYHKVGKSTRASNPTNKPLLPDIESIKNRFAYIRRYMPKAIIFFSYVSLIITVIRRIQRRQLSRIHIIIKAAITLKNPLLPPS